MTVSGRQRDEKESTCPSAPVIPSQGIQSGQPSLKRRQLDGDDDDGEDFSSRNTLQYRIKCHLTAPGSPSILDSPQLLHSVHDCARSCLSKWRSVILDLRSPVVRLFVHFIDNRLITQLDIQIWPRKPPHANTNEPPRNCLRTGFPHSLPTFHTHWQL